MIVTDPPEYYGADIVACSVRMKETHAQPFLPLVAATLFPRAQSWYMGANIPGKKREMLVYPGGLPLYLQQCKESADAGYAGFVLS